MFLNFEAMLIGGALAYVFIRGLKWLDRKVNGPTDSSPKSSVVPFELPRQPQ